MTNEEFNERLEQAMAVATPSYINFDDEWYDNNKEYVEQLANRMGYYFRLKGAKFAPSVGRGENTAVTLTFRNDGMAPIYEPCTVYLGLLDESGNLVERVATSADAKTWLPGKTVNENVGAKFSAEAGNYWLAVGLFGNENDGAPAYLLGSKSRLDGSDKWYALGQITVA